MSKETELSAILSHAAQAGLLPNTIHSWLPALTRYTESIIAADRELRRGDALMPVVGKINVSDEDDCRFYRHVDDQTPAGSFPLVKLSDAQAALTAQAVNAKRLTQAARDITTVLRVEGMDLEIGSRKLLKEARDAIDAAIAKEAAK